MQPKWEVLTHRALRYHYSLRLRTLLGSWEKYMALTTSGGNVTAGLSRCVRVISCLNLPRTDSGGEFDWGGTSVK